VAGEGRVGAEELIGLSWDYVSERIIPALVGPGRPDHFNTPFNPATMTASPTNGVGRSKRSVSSIPSMPPPHSCAKVTLISPLFAP